MLVLNECDLNRLEFPDVGLQEKTNLFPALRHLQLKRNNLSDTAFMDELNKLRSLAQLVILRNPVMTTMTEDTVRFILIAKIASIKLLNRSEITWQERKGAELDYLKKYGSSWKAAGGDQDPSKNKPSEDFRNQHPRYQELVDKYGPPEDSELKESSSAIKNNLIELTLKCEAAGGRKEMKKKVPLTMTVQKLKQLAHKLFKVNLDGMTLAYVSEEMPDQEINLEIDTKDIGFYSIDQGDTLLVKLDS